MDGKYFKILWIPLNMDLADETSQYVRNVLIYWLLMCQTFPAADRADLLLSDSSHFVVFAGILANSNEGTSAGFSPG